ncbi:MAG TPA: hypothetical protein VF779_02430 [Pyrinomonadaceae bacterium]
MKTKLEARGQPLTVSSAHAFAPGMISTYDASAWLRSDRKQQRHLR